MLIEYLNTTLVIFGLNNKNWSIMILIDRFFWYNIFIIFNLFLINYFYNEFGGEEYANIGYRR